MENILFSLSFGPVVYLSSTLSLSPFLKQLSRKKLAACYSFYLLEIILVFGLFYSAACSGHASFALVKHTLLVCGVVTTIFHSLILPRYIREWIFSSALATLFHYLIGAISTYIVYRTFGWHSVAAYARMELVTSLLIIIFYVPVRMLLVKTIRPFLAYGDLPYWRSIFMIPVAILWACYFMLPGNSHMESLAQVVGRLFMVATAFFICRSVSADFTVFQEKQTMEEQLRQQKLYYSSMQQSLENARRQRHDSKHHLVTIQHYIETGNTEGLQAYCNELLVRDEMKNPLPYSGNVAADGVLYHYMRQSSQHNIQFSIQGTIRGTGISDSDLSVLLGNALDNALTATMALPQNRFIRVSFLSEPNLLSILVQNSFDGTVEEKNGRILSRKRENREGVGLNSMHMICNRYGGVLDRNWDDHLFTLCIHLPISLEEG